MTAEPHTHAQRPSDEQNPVARLNDAFRHDLSSGKLVATAGVIARFGENLLALLLAVQVFPDFTPDNDPHGEHDFGAIDCDGTRLFWKIDCYDRGLQFASPDPADPAVTTRVLTMMLAEEY